jgi:hypothetical protein
MQVKLKRKYTCRDEPVSWYNRSGKKNSTNYGGGGNNQGKARTKKEKKPSGFSGKTIGNMVRINTTITDKKKK